MPQLNAVANRSQSRGCFLLYNRVGKAAATGHATIVTSNARV